MKKLVFTLLTAGSLLFANSTADVQASQPTQNDTASSYETSESTVVQVAASKATAKSGTFKMKYNTNVRADAGTKNKIVTMAKKGSVAKASYQKKVGKSTWYKVSVNGKSGWVLSTLLTSTSAKKTSVKQVASTKATAKSGTYKTKYNSNVRSDAGTKNKIVTMAKKGSIATATHQKKVGNTTWYKVKVNGKTGWISASLLTATTVKKASAKKTPVKAASTSSVVSEALSLQGIPYKFGGTTRSGFDCSGFVQYAYKQAGKNVSRTTGSQFAETYTVSNPQPGDLVFFANTYKAGISHVGIYIGNNQFVHSGGAKAEVKSMNDPYWGKKFHSFKRF